MPRRSTKHSRLALIASMTIFGTIGLVRRYIALPSATIALGRAWIGALFLVLLLLFKKQNANFTALRKNALLLLLSGTALGFNWIALFEAYTYTSVATATLCYYLAPILVILVSPLFFREQLNARKLMCILAALAGIVLVSGVPETGLPELQDAKGILFGLGAAVLYAAVIILNKKITDVPNLDRTLCQLLVSGIALVPYVIFSDAAVIPTGTDLALLAVAGIVHTGIAYALYFGSIPQLSAQTAALYSYLDPVLAIVLSALFLQEPMSPGSIIGAVLILGAAFLIERKSSCP